MTSHGFPALYALLLWWASTGAILFLDGLPRRSFRWSLAVATLLLAGSLYGLTLVAPATSTSGAYAGFGFGLAAWGWLELAFYLGVMVGPRRQADPTVRSGWRHFRHAAETTLYHEAGAALLAVMILALTWNAPNRVGLWTFLLLWGMQFSAKLNLFLGVPNLGEDLLPPHLAFLAAYMRRKPMNLFFPLSVTLAIVLTTLLALRALDEAASAFEASGATMLAALSALAVLEHWLLVLPFPVAAFWAWSLVSRRVAEPSGGAPSPRRESETERQFAAWPAASLANTASPIP